MNGNETETINDTKKARKTVLGFIKRNAVLCVATAAALISSFFIPPDEKYIEYFDFKTLTCLFCVLAVVCALRNIKFFTIAAEKTVSLFRTARLTVLALVCITFIGSMLIANDMALLTFLPLGFYILTSTGKEKYMATTFILQNIAANLGGMLTPFGNPQNLYLYSRFSIPDGEFFSVMAPPFILSITLIAVCCLFIKNEPLMLKTRCYAKLPPLRTSVYLALFALSILIVFRFISYLIGLAVVPVALFFLDRKALAKVDYGLLFTFVMFFVFAGNVSRIDAVSEAVGSVLSKNVFLCSAASCQVISNVPSAILLSRFTDNYRELLLGVNIGGVGTIISSLASLITFREYTSHNQGKAGSYLLRFSLFNFSFLIILCLFEELLFL